MQSVFSDYGSCTNDGITIMEIDPHSIEKGPLFWRPFTLPEKVGFEPTQRY